MRQSKKVKRQKKEEKKGRRKKGSKEGREVKRDGERILRIKFTWEQLDGTLGDSETISSGRKRIHMYGTFAI